MENTEKKPRKFIKMLGKVGEIVVQEALLKILRGVISRIGGKKILPSILFLILSICVYGQYPATGNKQRLGYQTSGDGLVWRGRASDTVALKSSTINNSYVILDTINNVMIVYIKTKGGWKYNNADTIIVNNNTDTTSLSSRINLKVNISDTASMLLKYLRKADTSLLNLNTRFAAKLNLLDTASMLTNYLRSGVAASTYLPLIGGTTTGLITSSFSNTTNYSTSAEDNNSFTIYNNTTSTNNIYGGLKFLIGENSGAIPGGPGLAQIYGIRAGGASNPSTDLTFSTKSNVSGLLEKMRIKFDGKVGIGTSTPSYLLDVNGSLGITGAATLLSTLSATTGTFTGLNILNPTTEGVLTLQGFDNNTPTRIQFKTTGNVRREIVLPTSDSNLEFRTSTIGGTQGGYSFYTRRNPNAEQLAFNIDVDGNSNFYGTLGVTGAATLSSTLAVTGNITEDGNNVLTNLDTTSLSSRIDGKVSLNGTETINGSKSFNNVLNVLNQMTISGSVNGLNKILGKNTDGNGVGDITVGTGLSLTSNTLNATQIDTASMLSPYWRSGRFSGTLPIANGGTGATSESNARTNLDVDYVFIAATAGAAVSLTSNRVFIVNTGSSSTTTLDLSPATSGRMYMVKNLSSGLVSSGAANVVPLIGGLPGTAILTAGNVTPQWVTLVADGTNWHIMQKN
jgi:hypothetical protein